MADLHAQDVIFNKPSLKELIRLIKNGTINAIWPSTDAEFRDWNNGGYLKYAPRGQKLKTQKTAMTVYYGDHQDSTSTGDINIEKTQENYNQVINAINNQKGEIVRLKYYDNTDNIYPIGNATLQLSLNTANGQINNAQNVINYKSKILEEYRKNITKINDFINRINNFQPDVVTTSFTLSDEFLVDDYNTFFTNSTNEVIENLRTIVSLDWNAGKEVIDTLVDPDTLVYDFSKINTLYNRQKNNVTNILNYIQKYYPDLSFNDQSIRDLESISTKYQLYKLQLQTKIANYYTDWENVATTNFNIIKKLVMPYIYSYNFTLEENELYEQDIEKMYEKYIYPYKNFIKYLFLLRYYPNSTIDDAEVFYVNIRDTMKDEVEKLSTLERKITYINQNFINQINLMASNITLLEKQNVEINYLNNGTIQDKENILNNLQIYFNILNYQKKIFEEYEILLSENQKATAITDISNFQNEYTKIDAIMNTLISGGELTLTEIPETIDSLANIQTKIIELYGSKNDSSQKSVQLEYSNFLIKIKNLNVTSITPLTFQISQTGITNLSAIQNSIQNQKNKMLDHYNILSNVLSYNMEETISNLNTEAQNITNRVNSATIVTTTSGDKEANEQAFNDQVIRGNDYSIPTINLLLERITTAENGIVSLSFTEEQIIPSLSDDYLSIKNKDTVITNLYSILNTGDRLNREYMLSDKIDNINALLQGWSPIYSSEVYSHYTCIAVGSDIQFDPENERHNAEFKPLPSGDRDGSITIIVDGEYHYPLINNMADVINSNTRNTQIPTIGGLRSVFGDNFDKMGTKSVGGFYQPVYLENGNFIASSVIAGSYTTLKDGGSPGWVVTNTNGSPVSIQAIKMFGAVFNDYAEYRSSEAKPGRCIIEQGNGALIQSTKRLQLGANIVSDTFGFAIGETDEAKCPVAVCGRVLAYPLEDRELYTPGAAVCSGPDGTISLMTREEIKEWPDAIVGYVSEVPTYDTWGSDNTPINGRIWIKIK